MTMSAIEHAAQMGMMKRAKPTYGYYRQPNGWITISPATDLEELKYRREGWEPLTQYGRVEMTIGYMADHPLEPLFMLGGAKELPVEQIVAMGLHLNPPLVPTCGLRLDQYHKGHTAGCLVGAKPVVFPQLESQNYPPSQCRFCERVLPTEKARDQHEGVMHKDAKSDIRTGEALAAAMVKGLKGDGAQGPSPNIPYQVTPNKPFVCGLCGEGFKGGFPLAKHIKSMHKAEEEEKNGEGSDQA